MLANKLVAEAEEVTDKVDAIEEVLTGDSGPLLVVWRTCLTPRSPSNDFQRNTIFQSTCTIRGKVYRFIIDLGSCENVMSEAVVQKLNLLTEPHPTPYTLAWLKRGNEICHTSRIGFLFH